MWKRICVRTGGIFINEGGYWKRAPSWDLFSKQNIFMTTRNMKNPKLELCKGRLGLSFYVKILANTVLLTKLSKSFVDSEKVKNVLRNVIFSRGVKSVFLRIIGL